MTTDQMDKVVRHQVSLDLRQIEIRLIELSEAERYKALYNKSLKLLVELGQ